MTAHDHDVSDMTTDELKRARRDAAVSLSLAWPDSPTLIPLEAQLTAIDDELAERGPSLHLCSCAFATDDPVFFAGHLAKNPGHRERD